MDGVSIVSVSMLLERALGRWPLLNGVGNSGELHLSTMLINDDCDESNETVDLGPLTPVSSESFGELWSFAHFF